LTDGNRVDRPDAPRDAAVAASGWRARLWRWVDHRTGANAILHTSLDEPIPGGARFAYVFGSALLFLFVSQLVTGVCLAVYYVPSPQTAHVTLAYIIKEVAGGAFLRSLHSYGSSAMVVVLVLHFLQTFLYGSYKGKRELLWIAGGVLSLLILGMTFTGFLLRWDLRAYFAGSVGTNIAGDVPLVGSWLLRMLRGGEAMGALTLSRFYVLHVFLLPGAIITFVAVHVFLFRKAGAAGPMREDPVQPRLPTEPFYPNQVIIDMGFVLVVMGIIGMLAHFVPVTLGPVADPSNSNYLPRPEWYYLPFFQWLKFWNGAKTVVGVVIIPAILIILAFLLPFLDRGRERRPWKRLIPVGSVLIVLIGLIGLGMQSRLDDSRDPTTASQIAKQDLEETAFLRAPFAPLASSLASAAVPAALTGPALHGQGLFQSHSCSSCHGVGGTGGAGPALTNISAKFTPAQLAALIKTPNAAMKAGGMSPLSVSAADLAALAAYVSSLGTVSAVSTTAVAPTGSPPGPVGVTASAPADTSSAPPAATAPPVTTPASAAVGRPANSQTQRGEALFAARGCTACHGIGGVGTTTAPALMAFSKSVTPAALTTLLEHPNHKMQSGGMPATNMSAADMSALVAYLQHLGGPVAATSIAAAPGAKPTTTSPGGQVVAAVPPSDSITGGVGGIGVIASPRSMSVLELRGRSVFAAHSCATCHGANGIRGTWAAPALANTGKNFPPALLTTLLQHPTARMRQGGMPPVALSADELNALVAYVAFISASKPASTPTPR